MNQGLPSLLIGEVVEQDLELTLSELCHACGIHAEQVFELMEFGVIQAQGRDPNSLRFRGVCIHRIRRTQRLKRDLGVNIAGAALALELLDEIDELNREIRKMKIGQRKL